MKEIRESNPNRQPSAQGTHLPHATIVKAPGLLPMRYTLRELADELGCSGRTLRAWANAGMPVERDTRGRIWVIGTQFAAWAAARRKQTTDQEMLPDQAYCMKCRGVVRIADPIEISNGKHVRLRGHCPFCGKKVYRGVKRG